MKDGPAYIAQDIWKEMPMAEYTAGFLDFRRVRGYCHSCGRYGSCWACPPYDFNEKQYLGQYRSISLLATKITPTEGTEFTQGTAERIISQERKRLDRMLLKMEHTASRDESGRTGADSGKPAARAFFAGTCLLCPPGQCTRSKSLPCRHPQSIRPSLEALGFDVALTASGLFGIPLQWGKAGAPPPYLTLVSAIARK